MQKNKTRKSNWKEFKGGVRNLWGEITDDELEASQGSTAAIIAIIQVRYDEPLEATKEKMERLINSFNNITDKNRKTARTSFERNPLKPRTSEISQVQDMERGGREHG